MPLIVALLNEYETHGLPIRKVMHSNCYLLVHKLRFYAFSRQCLSVCLIRNGTLLSNYFPVMPPESSFRLYTQLICQYITPHTG